EDAIAIAVDPVRASAAGGPERVDVRIARESGAAQDAYGAERRARFVLGVRERVDEERVDVLRELDVARRVHVPRIAEARGREVFAAFFRRGEEDERRCGDDAIEAAR